MERKQMDKVIITKIEVLPEIKMPRLVKAALLGLDEGRREDKNRAEYHALSRFRWAWQDSTLFEEDESLKTVFEEMKQRICQAIAEMDPYPFIHFAEALEQEKNLSLGQHIKRAIAATFMSLRYKYGEEKIPSKELKDETLRRYYPQFEDVEPNWYREFDELGIRPFLTKDKPGRKPRKSN
jgi:hypothetical protein